MSKKSKVKAAKKAAKTATKAKAAAKKPTKAAGGAKATSPAPKAAGSAKNATRAKRGREGGQRMSALDAAAAVLEKAGKAMNCRDLITAMAEQGLWTSPTGKTPASTLYAAVIREISAKGTDARFEKVERGQFAFNG